MQRFTEFINTASEQLSGERTYGRTPAGYLAIIGMIARGLPGHPMDA